MVRKSLNTGGHEETSASDARVMARPDSTSAFAPFIAKWCSFSARMIALTQRADIAHAEALARLATSMRDVGVLAAEARCADDLTTLASRLQQAWMELGSARQADLTQAWAEAREEAVRQLQSLLEQSASSTTKYGEAVGQYSPVAALMEQAWASLAKWSRDWAEIVKAPETVQ